MLGFLKQKKNERLVGIDIGSHSIKVVEIEINNDSKDMPKPRLLSAASLPTPSNTVSNHVVTSPEKVSDVIRTIISANGVKSSKAVIGLPGPTAFTKRITMQNTPIKDLQQNIQFEAGNYIPHGADSIKLDFQVLSRPTKTTMEVLLVAVKNDIINSFEKAVSHAGLEPVIADIDYFALENMFELSYPEYNKKCVALVNIGHKYTTVNIINNGASVFTGDISLGGRLYIDALCEALQIQALEAEKILSGTIPETIKKEIVSETVDRTTEHIVDELKRQIGFFWNATATDKAIEYLLVSGGAAGIGGLVEELGQKTKISCQTINPFKHIDWQNGFEDSYVKNLAPSVAVAVGLALRRLGDKVHSE